MAPRLVAEVLLQVHLAQRTVDAALQPLAQTVLPVENVLARQL